MRQSTAMPASGQAHWRLGQLYHLLNRDGEARQEFERAAGFPALAGAGRGATDHCADVPRRSEPRAARSRVAAAASHWSRTPSRGTRTLAMSTANRTGTTKRWSSFSSRPCSTRWMATPTPPSVKSTSPRGDTMTRVRALRRALTLKPDQRGSALCARDRVDSSGYRRGRKAAAGDRAAAPDGAPGSGAARLPGESAPDRSGVADQPRAGSTRRPVCGSRWPTANPACSSTYVSLGKALAKAGQHAQAIDAFERALQLSQRGGRSRPTWPTNIGHSGVTRTPPGRAPCTRS